MADPRPIDPAEPLPQPELTDAARAKLEPVIALLAADATAPSTVIEPERAWVVHVADSLSGLAFPELASARSRIKAKYSPAHGDIDLFFPPKWRLASPGTLPAATVQAGDGRGRRRPHGPSAAGRADRSAFALGDLFA